jgi:hypothetical protein
MSPRAAAGRRRRTKPTAPGAAGQSRAAGLGHVHTFYKEPIMTMILPDSSRRNLLQRSSMRYRDPTVRFEEMIAQAAVTLEDRTDEQLVRDGVSQSDPALREHALYQYMWRHGAAALPVIRRALYEDDDTDLRINLL